MPFPLLPQEESPPPASRVALKIDVDTLRGATRGVPALVDLLHRHGADGTFLFALGPDQSGRSIREMLATRARGGLGRPSVVERYGVQGLFQGTLLPAPLIGEQADTIVRATRDAGFEVGLRPWNPHAWKKRTALADEAWLLDQFECSRRRFVELLGTSPRVHAACGWTMSRRAFRLEQRLGFDYCSDTRGLRPYVPVLDAEIVACPQIPVTLPTFDELLAGGECDRNTVDERMLAAIGVPAPDGHVLNLSADCEGVALLPAFERLLQRMQSRGIVTLSLEKYLTAADVGNLPRFRVKTETLPGRTHAVCVQFKEFLV